MRGLLFAIAVAFAVYATPAHANPVALTFNLHIEKISGPNPELASVVLGEMPEVGSTVGMVALLEAGDQDSDPGTGHYYSPPCAIFGACPVGALTVGSSTSPVFAFGELFVYNDQNIFGTGLPQDAFYEALYGGTSTGSIFIDVGSFAPLLPTSTFTSDAIPPPTALQALQFQMFGSPNDYDFDEAGDECLHSVRHRTSRRVPSARARTRLDGVGRVRLSRACETRSTKTHRTCLADVLSRRQWLIRGGSMLDRPGNEATCFRDCGTLEPGGIRDGDSGHPDYGPGDGRRLRVQKLPGQLGNSRV